MLTKQQYKFLKKVSKKPAECGDLHQKEDPVYFYLLRKNFIRNYNVCPDGDVMEKDAVLYCEATEDGQVELLLCKQERFHFWIPTIISLIAIIVSIFSISAVPFIWTYAQELISQNVP